MWQKWMILLVLGCAAALSAGCTDTQKKPETTGNSNIFGTENTANTDADGSENDANLPSLYVVPSCEYGQIRAEWEVPADLQDTDAEIILYDFYPAADGDGAYEEFFRMPAGSGYASLSDALAWHYQETGIDTDSTMQHLAVRVNLYRDGALAASGLSYSLLVQDFFPAENGPVIGEELPLERITSLDWSGSGSTVEANFFFSLSFEEEPALLYASYSDETGYNEKEIPLDEESLSAFKNLLRAGSLVRAYASDPELEILDETEDHFSVSWQDMRDCDRTWYRFVLSEEKAQELRELFRQTITADPSD